MFKKLMVSLTLVLLAGAPALAQSNDTPSKKSDRSPAEKAAQDLRAMELFLGFAQGMMKMSIDQQQRKAEQDERAKELAAKMQADVKVSKLRVFDGVSDVYFDLKDFRENLPSISGVRLLRYVEIGDQTFAEFRSVDSSESWVIDMAKIAAVRVRSSSVRTSSK